MAQPPPQGVTLSGSQRAASTVRGGRMWMEGQAPRHWWSCLSLLAALGALGPPPIHIRLLRAAGSGLFRSAGL